MPTNNFQTDVISGTTPSDPFWYRFSLKSSTALIITAETNLLTYFRMQGYDTISSSWKTWVVQETPDPSASRYPIPNSVTISNAFIIDRWQA